jgi:hypothetical protein
MAPNISANYWKDQRQWRGYEVKSATISSDLNATKRRGPPLLQCLLLSKPCDPDRIVRLIQDSSELAQTSLKMILCGENCMVTPLHLAVFENCPVPVLKALFDAYPAAISTAEPRGGRYPIHLGLLKGGTSVGLEQIAFLMHEWPECTTRAVDSLGNVPLHTAVQYSTDAVIRHVLAVNSNAAEAKTARQRTALHLLSAARCQWDNVKVASTFPSDREVEDALLAAALTISTDTLQALVDANPAALQEKDIQGRVPLHLAAGVPFPRWDCLQLLCNAYSPALLVLDAKHKTPLQLHQRFGACGVSHCVDLSESSGRSSSSMDNDVVAAFLQDRTTGEKRKNHVLFKLLSKVQPKKNKHLATSSTNATVDLMNCYG